VGNLEQYDFDSIKLNLQMLMSKKYLVYVLLILLLCVAFYSRTEAVPNLGQNMVSPDDPYIFLRYATYISQHGILPSNDTLRMYPGGLEMGHEVVLSAYVGAGAFLLLHPLLPDLTVNTVGIYFAPVMLIFTLVAFFFLTREITKHDYVSLLATASLAFIPAILYRTTAGFFEKEPLFMLFMILTFYALIKAEKLQKWYYGVIVGVLTFLAALSSALTILILFLIPLYYIVKVLVNKTSINDIKQYLVWMLTTFSLLVLSGQLWFSLLLSHLQIQPAILALCILSFSLIKMNLCWRSSLYRFILGALTFVAIYLVAAPNVLLVRLEYLAGFLGYHVTTGMISSVSENQMPTLGDIFTSLNMYFVIAICAIFALLYLWYKQRNTSHLFAIVWFMFTAIMLTMGIRMMFTFAFSTVFIVAVLVNELLKIKKWFVPHIIAVVFIALISFNAFVVISSDVGAYNDMSNWNSAMAWVNTNTATDSAFVSWWDYGYLIQALGNRATVADPENYNSYVNYDIGGHLFTAKNNSEVLKFLNAYGNPDYFLISNEDIGKFYQISRLGAMSPGAEGRGMWFTTYRVEKIIPNNIEGLDADKLAILSGDGVLVFEDFRFENRLYDGDITAIGGYVVLLENDTAIGVRAVVINNVLGTKQLMEINCVCTASGCIDINTDKVPTCIILGSQGVVNIPYKSKDYLFTQLYLLQQPIEGYEEVYHNTLVTIYKLNYTEIAKGAIW